MTVRIVSKKSIAEDFGIESLFDDARPNCSLPPRGYNPEGKRWWLRQTYQFYVGTIRRIVWGSVYNLGLQNAEHAVGLDIWTDKENVTYTLSLPDNYLREQGESFTFQVKDVEVVLPLGKDGLGTVGLHTFDDAALDLARWLFHEAVKQHALGRYPFNSKTAIKFLKEVDPQELPAIALLRTPLGDAAKKRLQKL